jgi:hypothetical protein
MSPIFKSGIRNDVNSSSDIQDLERVRHARPERQNAITPRIVLAATLSVCLGGALGCGVEDPTDLSDDEEGGAHIESVQSDVTAASCTLHLFPPRWMCNNRVAPVYRDPNTTHQVDTLKTNPSVFRCRVEGAFSGGGPHPYGWERTQGDVTHAWGYVRDIDIASETNILPPC